MWNDILANCDLLFILCTFIAHSINHGGISFNTWAIQKGRNPSIAVSTRVFFANIVKNDGQYQILF